MLMQWKRRIKVASLPPKAKELRNGDETSDRYKT
jgi:hypothetical protein